MKILITGSKGQLGTQLMNTLAQGSSSLGVIPKEYSNCSCIGYDVDTLDITNLSDVRRVLKAENPDMIVNCAAYTNVDNCENNFDIAYKINSLGPRNLAIAASEINSKIVHISTDYVFRGDGEIPYKEFDITNPTSAYGKSKLLGEQYVREFSRKYFIVRTSWLYSYYGNNFVKTIIKAAKERGSLTVVNDQIGNPTNAEDLVFHILKLMITDEFGLYHCTGEGQCSWYDFAKAIVGYANIKCTVDAITSDQLNRAAKRPSFSSLDNMMLRCTVKNEMRNWEDALREHIELKNKEELNA